MQHNPWELLTTKYGFSGKKKLIDQKIKALNYILDNIRGMNSIYHLYDYLLYSNEVEELKHSIVYVINELMNDALSKNKNNIFGHYFDNLQFLPISLEQIPFLSLLPDCATLLGIASMNRDGYVREKALNALNATVDKGVAFPYLLRRLNDHVLEIRNLASNIILHKMADYDLMTFVKNYYGINFLKNLKHAQNQDIIHVVYEHIQKMPNRLDLVNLIHGEPIKTQFFILDLLRDFKLDTDLFKNLLMNSPSIIKNMIIKKFDIAYFSEKLIISFLQHKSASIRHSVLLKLTPPLILNHLPLIERLLYDTSSWVRGTAQYVLSQNQAIDFRLFYRNLLNNADYKENFGVIMGLADFATLEDTVLLEAYIYHPNKKVRAIILNSLNRLNQRKYDAIIVQGLLDTSSSVRNIVKKILIKCPSDKDNIIREFFNTKSHEVKIACFDVLASRKSYLALNDILFAVNFKDDQNDFRIEHKLEVWRQKFATIYSSLDLNTYREIKLTLDKVDPYRKKYNWVDRVIDFALQK